MFCAGAGMLAARMVSMSRDILNLIPVTVRLLRYVSGVFFSIAAYAGHGWISTVLQYQPVSVYLSLVRTLLLKEYSQDPMLWIMAGVWAVLFLVTGSIMFWRAEMRYGRD